MITGCTDDIATNGLYTSTLDLFRLRGLTDSTIDYTQYIKNQEEAKKEVQEEGATLEQRKGYLAYLDEVAEQMANGRSEAGGGGRHKIKIIRKELIYEYS